MAATAAATKTHRQNYSAISNSSSSSATPQPLLPALSSFESVRRRLAYKDDVDNDDDDATSVCTTIGMDQFYSGSENDSSDGDDERNKPTTAVAKNQVKVVSGSNTNAKKTTSSDDNDDDDEDDEEDSYSVDGTCSVGVLRNAKVHSEFSDSDSSCYNFVSSKEKQDQNCCNGKERKAITPTGDISNITAGRHRSTPYFLQNHSKSKHRQKLPHCEPEFLWAHHVQSIFASPPPPPVLLPSSTAANQVQKSTSGFFYTNSPPSEQSAARLMDDITHATSNPKALASHQPTSTSSTSSVTSTNKVTTTARRKLIISKTFVAPSSTSTYDRGPLSTMTSEGLSLPALAAARAVLQQQQQQHTYPPSSSNKFNSSSSQRFYMLTPQSSESGGSSLNTTPTSLVTTTATTTTTTTNSQTFATAVNSFRNPSETTSEKIYTKPFSIMSPVEHQYQPQSASSPAAAAAATIAFPDFATFDAYDLRLQQHVRYAIVQVREAAKLQVLQERNARRHAVMRPRLAQYLPAGKYRFDRTLLSSALRASTATTSALPTQVLSHLQVIVQELYDGIEKRNDELVQLLVLRDELSMEQDSILVDLQDLQRRTREKMLYQSTPRAAITSAKVNNLPKSCSLTFPQQNQAQQQPPDRISFAQKLFSKGLGRRTSFAASAVNTSNSGNSAVQTTSPLPVTSPSTSTALQSPLAMLGQRFFNLMNFSSNSNNNSSANQNHTKSKYQPVSLHATSNHSGSPFASSITTTGGFVGQGSRCGETASSSESGRENNRVDDDDDDDEDDDDYFED